MLTQNTQVLAKCLRNAIYLNYVRNLSSRVPQTIFIEKHLEAPVVVVAKDNIDVIGPPDPVSNLRPVIRRPVCNETNLQRTLREMLDETQEWNQNFWKAHNTKFVKERQEYIKLYLLKNGEQQPNADDMSEFYKRFLDENWESHVRYNIEWYRRNFRQLFLALRVSVESMFLKL